MVGFYFNKPDEKKFNIKIDRCRYDVTFGTKLST